MPNGAVRMDGMPCGPLCTDCWAFERLTVESFVHKFDHLDGSRNPHIPPLSMRRDDLRYGNSSGTWTNPCAEHNNASLELRNVCVDVVSFPPFVAMKARFPPCGFMRAGDWPRTPWRELL
jgi:hypothetical protein